MKLNRNSKGITDSKDFVVESEEVALLTAEPERVAVREGEAVIERDSRGFVRDDDTVKVEATLRLRVGGIERVRGCDTVSDRDALTSNDQVTLMDSGGVRVADSVRAEAVAVPCGDIDSEVDGVAKLVFDTDDVPVRRERLLIGEMVDVWWRVDVGVRTRE